MTGIAKALSEERALLEANIRRLEGELVSLQESLRGDVAKLEHVNALLAAYGQDGVTDRGVTAGQIKGIKFVGLSAVSQTNPANNEVKEVEDRREKRSKSEMITDEVVRLLQMQGSMHRQKILDQLILKGIMGHEKEPLAALAAYLSNKKQLFMPDGRGNFSLRTVR